MFPQVAAHLFGPAADAAGARPWVIETKYYTAHTQVLEFCSVVETDAPNVLPPPTARRVLHAQPALQVLKQPFWRDFPPFNRRVAGAGNAARSISCDAVF